MVRSRRTSGAPNHQVSHFSHASACSAIPDPATLEDDDEDQVRQRLLENSDPHPRHHVPLAPSHRPRPPRQRAYFVAFVLAAAVVLTFFFLAPPLGSVLRPHSSSATWLKPVGPPGSITDNTQVWAAQGGSYKNQDLEAGFREAERQAPLSNGTHKFRKSVILVSLDGFRADYLDRNLTPTLVSIAEKGLKATSMKPQFPSLTFPNHWSMLTGLYPESHGVIANDFWDPTMNKSFNYVEPQKSWDSFWWLGEPIWSVAVRLGLRTAVLMWPGPPYTSAQIRPTFWRPYEEAEWAKRVHLIESWLDLPVKDRPQFMAVYVPDVDAVGHSHGPDDLVLNKTLSNMDRFASALHESLSSRNLLQIVDVVYVSDHGMSATSDSRVILLDEILGEEDYERIMVQQAWPLAGLRFSSGVDTRSVFEKLMKAAENHEGFDVYTRETMPAEWHWSNNDRIAPISVVPRAGWVISNTHEYRDLMNSSYTPKGVHGYDNNHPEMQSIFMAHGPFTEKIKRVRAAKKRTRSESTSKVTSATTMSMEEIGMTIPSFSNVEVFSLVAKLLDIDAHHLPPTNCTEGFWDQYF